MMRRLPVLAFAVLTLGLNVGEADAQQTRANVFLVANTPDQVGVMLAYQLKEQLRRSSSMQLSLTEKDAFFQLRVVTVDPSANNSGYSTVYSVVWTTKSLSAPDSTVYENNSVGVCGRNAVDQCAAGIIAKTDELVVAYEQALQRAIEKKPQ